MVAARLANVAQYANRYVVASIDATTQRDAAALLNVGRASVQRARAVIENAPLEVTQAVERRPLIMARVRLDDFDPNDPANHAAAAAAQSIASASSRAIEGDTLPEPPAGLPALRSTAGAAVLGYVVRRCILRDCYGPDGRRRVPGNPGFMQAQRARLGLEPMPAGWRFATRDGAKLFALIDGNPTLLEAQARAAGYSRACATAPNLLDLGEIEP